MEGKKRPTFPKGFFTKLRPQVNKENLKENTIPFKWSKNVLTGKSKVKIIALEKK